MLRLTRAQRVSTDSSRLGCRWEATELVRAVMSRSLMLSSGDALQSAAFFLADRASAFDSLTRVAFRVVSVVIWFVIVFFNIFY